MQFNSEKTFLLKNKSQLKFEYTSSAKCFVKILHKCHNSTKPVEHYQVRANKANNAYLTV